MEATKVAVSGILLLFLVAAMPPVTKWFYGFYESRSGQASKLTPASVLLVLSVELFLLGMLFGVAGYFRWPAFASSQWNSIQLWLSVIGVFSTLASIGFIRSILNPDGHASE